MALTTVSTFSDLVTSAPQAHQPRPLMAISAVSWKLDAPEDQVMRLLEDGRLLWAFNISVHGSDGCRLVVRVLTQSVLHFQIHGQDQDRSWEAVKELIFNRAPATLNTCEMSRILGCSRLHTFNLIHAGLLKVTRPARRGRTGSPAIDKEAAAAWLKSRRL